MSSFSRRTPLERVEYVLIVSTLLLLVVFTLQPLLNLLALSFTEPGKVPSFSGLSIIPDGFSTDVWALLLQHPNVQRGMFNSIWMTATSVCLGVFGTWMKNAEGKWVNARVTDAEKAKIEFYARLASKGLFDKEYVTNTYDVKEDKFYTGKAGVIFGSSPEVIDIYSGKMRQTHPDADVSLVLLPVPSGPGGKGLAAVDVSKEARGWAISALSEHKEEAFKVLEFMASKEGQDIDRLGFEGVHHNTAADGSVTYTDAISTWYARFFNASNWTPPTPLLGETAQAALDNIKADFVADNAFVWPAEYAAEVDATEQIYRAWVARFITGEASIDQWDQFVSEYNAAGGARMAEYAASVLGE